LFDKINKIWYENTTNLDWREKGIMAYVLIVDDMKEIRDLLVDILKDHEISQAESFQNAADLIPMLQENGCTVAVLDGAFPNKEDGENLAALLRENIPGIRIVSHSAYKQQWGDVNLVKPVRFEELCSAVTG
jgi:DNA-binding NtrC family response regulator